jgi:hypothetical protein
VFALGVTVIVAVIADDVVFVAVKAGTFPVPLAAMPTDALLFVQLNVAPVTLLVKDEAVIVVPAHAVMFAGTVTSGVGLTVIVYVDGVPGQLATVGVTVIVAVTELVPIFTAVKDGCEPVPLAARPMVELEFTQLNVPPAGLLVNADKGTVAPLHTVMLAGTVTVGTGLTVIV